MIVPNSAVMVVAAILRSQLYEVVTERKICMSFVIVLKLQLRLSIEILPLHRNMHFEEPTWESISFTILFCIFSIYLSDMFIKKYK